MALIKYYNLVSHSWDIVSELELDLQKRLLSEKQLQKELSVSVDKAVEARANGDVATLNSMVYDSGEFDILYKHTNEISARKTIKTGWFKQDSNIPEKVGVELVVKATLVDLLQLQEYLQSSKFDLVEARAVSQATLAFATVPAHTGASNGYFKMIAEIISEKYKDISCKFDIQDDITWENDGIKHIGTSLKGIIYGPVESTLHFRNMLMHSADSSGVPLRSNSSISFS